MLAPIRLTNAGSCPSRQRDCVATAARSAETKGTAQLVLRTQVRRKETHPHHPSAPLPPLRVANPYKTRCPQETYHSANVGIGRGALQDARITRLVANCRRIGSLDAAETYV